jgi:hypothetical protein
MFTNGAIPSLLLALAMVSSGSIAMADSPIPKPPTQVISVSKGAQGAKPTSWVDPFAEPSASARPAARPATAAPPKPATAAPPKPAVAAPPKPEVTAAAPPPQSLPSKELEAFMKAFEGRWKCSTKFPPGSLGPGSQLLNTRTDLTIKKEFGGFSWHGEFKLAKTAITSATSGVFQIGYAAGPKLATFLSYDSVGSAMMGAGTLGGDSITFAEEGFLRGAKVRVRETLAKKGPRTLYHQFEIEQGSGYQVMAEDTCAK